MNNDNKVIIPESSGKGIGKGVEKLGEGFGKGLEKSGEGLGYLLKCCGDRIKYGKIDKTIEILNNSSESMLISTAKKIQEEIKEAKTLIESIQYREEENLRKFIKEVVNELIDREINNKEMPKKFKDSDNSLLIEKYAKETSDENLLKMWALLFVEESINSNSINKIILDFFNKLDRKTAEIIQNNIFQICLDYKDVGSCWISDYNYLQGELLFSRILAEDLNILKNYSTVFAPKLYFKNNIQNINFILFTLNDKYIFCHPGYNFRSQYYLTSIGIEIKKLLKIFPNKNNIDYIINCLLKNKEFFVLDKRYTKINKVEDYFILADGNLDNSQVLYPKNKYNSVIDYINQASNNIKLR